MIPMDECMYILALHTYLLGGQKRRRSNLTLEGGGELEGKKNK